MSDMHPREVVATLRRLQGQLCTPEYLSKHVVAYCEERGLAKFIEWPSGHWSVTDNGRIYISENSEPVEDYDDE